MTRKKLKLRCINKLAVITSIVFLLYVFIILSGLFKEKITFIGNIFITLLSFLALLSMFLLYRRFPNNFPSEKRGRFFFLIALFLFFIGDLLWLLNEVFLKNLVPIGGWPDLSWSIAYFFLIASLVYILSTEFHESNILFYTILGLGTIISGVFIYGNIITFEVLGELTINQLLQYLYPIYDVVLFIMVIYLIYPLIKENNKFFIGWGLFAIGIISRIVYDLLFANMIATNSYSTGHYIDIIYVIFYVAIVFNNLSKCKIMNYNIENG